jgi:hypothetical protein
MRWLGRRRRRPSESGEMPAASFHRQAWAEVALPPPLDAPPLEPATWSPATEPVTDVFPPVLVGSVSRVRLGFADGTSVEVASDSAESDAFRATATRLLEASNRAVT